MHSNKKLQVDLDHKASFQNEVHARTDQWNTDGTPKEKKKSNQYNFALNVR